MRCGGNPPALAASDQVNLIHEAHHHLRSGRNVPEPNFYGESNFYPSAEFFTDRALEGRPSVETAVLHSLSVPQ